MLRISISHQYGCRQDEARGARSSSYSSMSSWSSRSSSRSRSFSNFSSRKASRLGQSAKSTSCRGCRGDLPSSRLHSRLAIPFPFTNSLSNLPTHNPNSPSLRIPRIPATPRHHRPRTRQPERSRTIRTSPIQTRCMRSQFPNNWTLILSRLNIRRQHPDIGGMASTGTRWHGRSIRVVGGAGRNGGV